MKFKNTIRVEFEGKSRAALEAAWQRGLSGLREGITKGMMHASTGIDTDSVKITSSEPEISE